MNWNDAQAYARWLGQRTGQRYRLPSEAEWEYAARAGTTTRYSFGDDETRLCAYANVADRAAKSVFPTWETPRCSDGHVYTASVHSFEPNAWALHDMHGNAWEWVQDCKAGYKGAPTDGSAVEFRECAARLLRGGAWSSIPRNTRSAVRNGSSPTNRFNFTGLRLTRMLP